MPWDNTRTVWLTVKLGWRETPRPPGSQSSGSAS